MSENNGYSTGYIPDGYTLQGYIAEVDRLHPAVRFSFRPCTPEERATWAGKAAQKSDKGAEQVAALAISKHVNSWDVKRPDGEDVDIEAAACNRLQPTLKTKMYLIVTGDRPSDPPPDDPGELEDEIDAALAGMDQVESDVKN